MRARVRAARVPFWVSFIPVMKYKPTLPRARTRAALLDSLAPAPSHAPHEIGGCDPESAQRCRWRAHHTRPSCLHHSCTHCPVWPGRGARSGMAARLNRAPSIVSRRQLAGRAARNCAAQPSAEASAPAAVRRRRARLSVFKPAAGGELRLPHACFSLHMLKPPGKACAVNSRRGLYSPGLCRF